MQCDSVMSVLDQESVKSQIANIFSFTSHVVFVITAQLCHCNVRAAIGNPHTNEHGCV